jgi:hypothetical protein
MLELIWLHGGSGGGGGGGNILGSAVGSGMEE